MCSSDLAERRRARLEGTDDTGAAEPAATGQPQATGYPVPPLDLPHYHGVGVTGSGQPEGVPHGRTLLDAGLATNGKEVTDA